MPQGCCSKEEEARQLPKSRGEETPATATSASVPDNADKTGKPAAATGSAAAAVEELKGGKQLKPTSLPTAAALAHAMRGK